MGNRSKSLLKKGQSLGERAILEGEPAGETCSAGSPVLALIVNRQAPHTLLLLFCRDGLIVQGYPGGCQQVLLRLRPHPVRGHQLL